MAEHEMPKKLGRYEVVRELGKGAMGVVYEGKDPTIGRRVAIKTARRDVMEASGLADEMMERFLREGRAAGQLNHPNIITIYDAGEEEGMAWIAMEYLEGGDLRDEIENRRGLEIEQIAGIGADICEALAAAHEQGVIHRDIKPANIMIPDDAPLKVADFGIAHVSDSTLTQDGALIGTPHYMSPEQFMGQKLDGRSDLFSVANILYELLTGEKPFTGESVSTVMHHVLKTDPAPPAELNYTVPVALSQVVMKGLSKRSPDRYADGKAMAIALRESIKPEPDPAVLGLTAADLEGTTVTQPAPAGDATVVMPSTGAPQAADASSTGGAADTLPGKATATAEADATVPGQAPPGTVTQAPPAVTPATPEKSRVPLIAGGVVVLLVLVGGGIFMMGGGETGPDEMKAATNEGDAAPVISKLSVDVFYTTDPFAFSDSDSAMMARTSVAPGAPDPHYATVTKLEEDGSLIRLEGATVIVRNSATNDIIGENKTDDVGQCLIEVRGKPDKVDFEVQGHIGGKELNRTWPITGTEYWLDRPQFFVLKTGES